MRNKVTAIANALLLSVALIAVDALAASTGSSSSSSSSTSNQATTSSATSTSSSSSSSSTSSRILRSSTDYHVLEEVPHDTSSFTQGLTYFDGHIYEGTGLEQQSSLMRHDPRNQMSTLDKAPLEPHLFGEGIAHYHVWKSSSTTDDEYNNNNNQQQQLVKEDRLIQLTWKNKVGKIYSLPGLEELQDITYDTVTGEGWGITFVPHTNEFYVSDGSEYLMVWDATTLEEKRRIAVTFEREPGSGAVDHVQYVNELEFVDFAATASATTTTSTTVNDANNNGQCLDGSGGSTCSEDAAGPLFTPSMKILANIWYQDVIVAIDPQSGSISRVYDMRDLYPVQQRQTDGADCLNGISVTGTNNEEGLEVWVTGKLWPKMYRLQLIN